ncbi:ras family small GTPase [Reticulomyxa filosa]|uniref:Ras family small GTPase n=1 Tax=Reticulomyxa filosa TaxID=46433 RepID=X6M4I9_RETFI|nr:ras family small GTPase [Reticulomyxa filosa]|eukprot:ETO08839.1 ras family small GTPase [Reticulomyxa filosa]
MYAMTNRKEEEFKIVIVRYRGSGKSNLVIRVVTSYFWEDYDPTIEGSYRKFIDLNKVRDCLINVLDTAGEENIARYRSTIRNCDCVVIVYDVVGPYLPEEVINDYFSEVRRVCNVNILIAETKTDLRCDFLNYKQNLDYVVNFCKQRNLCIIETSAKEDVNVDFLFTFAVYNLWFDSFED